MLGCFTLPAEMERNRLQFRARGDRILECLCIHRAKITGERRRQHIQFNRFLHAAVIQLHGFLVSGFCRLCEPGKPSQLTEKPVQLFFLISGLLEQRYRLALRIKCFPNLHAQI